LAKVNKDISGIVLMATPYRLKFEEVMDLTAKVLGTFKRYHKKSYPLTFGASRTITRLISYQQYPINNMLELAKLVKESRVNLDKITQPCFVMQSSSDHIITKNSLIKIYEKISSDKKEKKYIDKVYHTFISDIRNEHVFEDILNFLNKI
jgi:esterase/lipase